MRVAGWCLVATLGVSLVAPTVQAAPKVISACSQVLEMAPYGVARDAKSASSAVRQGFIPPVINRSLYKRAASLDARKPRGFVCATKLEAARKANTTGYFRGTDSNDPAEVLTGLTFAKEGSLAANYLNYLSRVRESNTWSSYQSAGKVVPTVIPPTVTLQGDVATVVSGTTQQQFTITFDSYGKPESWSTETGELASRLFAVKGTATGAGVSIDVDWTYRTISGPVVTTGYATNTSGQAIRLAAASYRAPDGGVYEGYTSGTCINPGQRIPIDLYTNASAPAAASGSWSIEVRTCDFLSVGSLELTFGPR